MADISKPSESVVKNVNPVPEQNKPTDHDNGPKDRTEVVVKLVPCPNCNDESAKKTKDPSQYPKRILAAVLAIVPIFISIYAAVISTGSQSASWDSARNSGRSADAAGKTADAAQKNVATAQAALKATIENSRLDARAWVGVTEVVNSTIEKDVPIQITVTLQGSGKTPAVNVRVKTVWSVFPKEDGFCPWYGDNLPQNETSEAVVFPNQKVFLSTIPQSLDPRIIARLETGDSVLYHYGTIDYEDVFDPPTAHCTTFCYVYNRDLKMPHPCGTYNKVTDTKCEAGCPAPPSVLK